MAQNSKSKDETEFETPDQPPTTTTTTLTSCVLTVPARRNQNQNQNHHPFVFRDDDQEEDRDPTVVAEDHRDRGHRDRTTVDLIKREVNRCFGCRRKVGLTGFRCRCGEVFCGEHRYSDRHDCEFDYKSAGREMIKRENPVVKAAKIIKI